MNQNFNNMWFQIFILTVCSVNIIYSNKINNKNGSVLLINDRTRNSLGITKEGPCTAKLDDGSLVDLSKLNFLIIF